MKLKTVAGIALAGICSLWTVNAFAEDSVAVMKFDALGADTEGQANLIFEALRSEVDKSSTKLEANGGDITYTEMQAVTGCDTESSIACYDVACETLGAPAIIFGQVEDGGKTKIVWYVSGKGIFREVTGTVTDEASAQQLAQDMVIGEKGTLLVTTNVPDAEIFIDGKSYGMSTTPEDTARPIELVAGNYIISIKKQGYNKEDSAKIVIEGHKTATYHLDLTEAADPEEVKRALIYAGFPTLGVGAALAIAGGVGMFLVHKANNDMNDDILKKGKYEGNYTFLKVNGSNGSDKMRNSITILGVGAGLAAAGVALVIVAYTKDWTGEGASEEAGTAGYMPKMNFQVSPEYQGMTMGWMF